MNGIWDCYQANVTRALARTGSDVTQAREVDWQPTASWKAAWRNQSNNTRQVIYLILLLVVIQLVNL
jgi:hypothetical protein